MMSRLGNQRVSLHLTAALLVAFFFVLLAPSAFPQSDTGTISGTVTDSSGAVVPGAQVTVTSKTTDRTVTVTTGNAGDYSVPSLNPGPYTVEVKAPNFKTLSQDVILEVSQVIPLNVSLSAGSTAETVQVTSEAPPVDTATSNIGDVIQGRQVTELPLNGRNFTQLATLVPGVTRGPNINGNATGNQGNAETYRYNTSGGAALSVNGLRAQANNFLLDGFDNNESLVNTIIFFSSPDAIQEFQVQTNVAPAEFGRAGGAIVNTAIKSGTNQIHGSAYEFLRNSALDADPWTPEANAKKLPFKQNQFGGSIGAPIIKNKLFVFGDYQGLRNSQPASTDYATVPTLLMRNSGFTNFSELLPNTLIYDPLTDTPYPGNIITTPLNPAAVNYLNAYPLPNCNNSINPNCHFLTQNYTVTRQRIETINDFDIRTDYNIGSKDSAFGRYSYGNDNLTTTSRLPDLPAGFGSGTNPTKPWAAVLEETHLFSSNLVNEARFGFIHTLFGYTPPFDNVPLSANLGIVNANVNGSGQPDPELGGGALIGGNNNQLEYTGDYGPYLVPQSTWQYADNLSWQKGKHSLKFGADVLRRQVNFFRPLAGKGFFNVYGNGTTDGNAQKPDGSNVPITGYEVTDLLVGFTHQYSVGPVLGDSETRNWETGYYAQDDWHISRKLTLNLGIRYDLITWPVEKYNRQANFNINTGAIEIAGQNGASRSFIPVATNNWAPRIGFAYDPIGDGKSKFSGGYGIFYFVDRGGISNQLAQNPPFSGQTTYTYENGYRVTFTGQAPLGSNNPVGATIPLPSKGPIQVNLNAPANVSISIATLPSNVTPSVQEWNLQYERELGNNMSFSMAYVGDKGTHLTTYYDYNRQYYNAPNNTKNFPLLGSINTQATIGNSSYNSLQLRLNRRFAQGLQFGAAYTWSHAIDDSPDAFDAYNINGGSPVDYRNLGAERGNSNLDARNRFVLNGLYDLPFGRGRQFGNNWNGVTNAALGGWQTNIIFTAQSGTPFDVLCGGNPTVRCDLVGNPYANLGPLQYFNPAAFAPVPSNSAGVTERAGTTPRNYLTGPGFNDVDFSVFKDFRMTERVITQFRAEFFNLFNTPQYIQPDANYTDCNPNSLGACTGNFGRITTTRFSSERQIQFALRVSF
jgi:hypothetical protein